MKRALLFSLLFLLLLDTHAQLTSTILVYGDADKFYPVVFSDNNWSNHRATEIEIGRSDVHEDQNWRGSLISKFRIHTNRWGNGSALIDADIAQRYNRYSVEEVPFIAGFFDASRPNATFDFVIWLRGATTYHYASNTAQSPSVYDGVQHALPYQEINGSAHSFKTQIEPYVNSYGKNSSGTLFMEGAGLNYLNGDLGLGTRNTSGFKLAVNGKIRAQEVKVEATNWPDYVFGEGYQIDSLEKLESYIKVNRHLPDIPSADEVSRNGVELGQLNKLLLKKIEEITLYLIEIKKENKTLADRLHQFEHKAKKGRE